MSSRVREIQARAQVARHADMLRDLAAVSARAADASRCRRGLIAAGWYVSAA